MPNRCASRPAGSAYFASATSVRASRRASFSIFVGRLHLQDSSTAPATSRSRRARAAPASAGSRCSRSPATTVNVGLQRALLLDRQPDLGEHLARDRDDRQVADRASPGAAPSPCPGTSRAAPSRGRRPPRRPSARGPSPSPESPSARFTSSAVGLRTPSSSSFSATASVTSARYSASSSAFFAASATASATSRDRSPGFVFGGRLLEVDVVHVAAGAVRQDADERRPGLRASRADRRPRTRRSSRPRARGRSPT